MARVVLHSCVELPGPRWQLEGKLSQAQHFHGIGDSALIRSGGSNLGAKGLTIATCCRAPRICIPEGSSQAYEYLLV
jgi:hypothetical protein